MTNTVPLGRIANISTGGTPDRKTPEYWGGTIPWVGTGEIDFNTITTATDHLTEAGLAASAAKVLPAGTLLMAMYGQGATRGKVGLLGMEAATNQACAAIQPKEKDMETRFLFLVLEASYHRIRQLSNTGGQDNLNTALIKEIPIPQLSRNARQQIVQAAERWNCAVQLQTELLDRLTLRQRGLMQQLLTGDQRLKGFSEPWSSVRLGSIVSRITRRNTSGCTRALTVSAQRGLVEQGSYFAKQMAAEDNAHYLLMQRGEFAYNRSAAKGCPYGAIKRLDDFAEGIVSTLCLCFGIAAPERVLSDFLKAVFDAGLLNRQLAAIAHEGARSHGLLNVTSDDFFQMRVGLPPLPEQEAIARVLNEAAEAVRLQQEQLDLLRQQKRALLHRLLGQATA